MVSLRIRPAIILFGDSITQQGFGYGERGVGWASLLARDYSRRADIFNRGYSGYNTRMAVEELLPNNEVFGTPPGDNGVLFCTVFFGANDAALPGERQHVPIEEYGSNLAKIVTTIRQDTKKDGSSEDTTIILMTPPPFDAAAWRRARNVKVDDRQNEVARSYGDKVKDVAQEYNCTVFDVWETLRGNTTPQQYGKYLSDGLHLSEDGNRKLHEGLMELIRSKLPHLAPLDERSKVGVPLDGKLWRELC